MVGSGYQQTEIGTLPTDWEVKPLPQLAWFQEGPGLRNWQFTKSGMKVINVTNLENGYLNIHNTDRHISLDEFSRTYSHFEIDPGDIVMASSGNSYCKTAVVRERDLPLMMNTSVIRFKPSNEIDYRFLYSYIGSYLFKNQIDLLITGGAQPNFGPYHLKKVLLPVPTKKEQLAIAEALADADRLIDGLDRLIAKKRAMKTAVMQELLTGKKRLPGFEADWKSTKLGDISDIRTGKKNNQDKVSDGIYPFFVRSQTVERIDTFSYDGEAILVPGEGGIGSIFHYVNGKFDFHQRVYKISDFTPEIHGKFIFYYMIQFFEDQATRNSVKATVDSLRLPTFQNFELEIPELQEQIAIAKILSDIDSEIATLEDRRNKTQVIKKGMMQELLNGRTRLLNCD